MKNELVSSSNSAGRVYRILATAKDLDLKGTAVAGWAKVFSLHPTDDVRVFARLTAMQDEMSRARSEFQESYGFGVTHDPFPKLVVAIQQASLQQQWAHVVAQIDSSSMTALGFLAEKLPADSSGAEVNDGDLEGLAKEVDKLISETLIAGLDESFCGIIVDRLQAIKKAILMYKIYGNRGLDDATRSTVGSMLLNRGSLTEEPPRDFIKKLAVLVDKIQNLIHTGQKVIEFASTFAGLLPS